MLPREQSFCDKKGNFDVTSHLLSGRLMLSNNRALDHLSITIKSKDLFVSSKAPANFSRTKYVFLNREINKNELIFEEKNQYFIITTLLETFLW